MSRYSVEIRDLDTNKMYVLTAHPAAPEVQEAQDDLVRSVREFVQTVRAFE